MREAYCPVSEYEGTKAILISTRTVLGGKNPFFGIAYVVVGGICVPPSTVLVDIKIALVPSYSVTRNPNKYLASDVPKTPFSELLMLLLVGSVCLWELHLLLHTQFDPGMVLSPWSPRTQ
jgi:hypothetical protein